MQEVKLCEGVRLAARPLDKIGLFGFVNSQVCLPQYRFFTRFGCHRNYKRKKREKRPKKFGKSQKKQGNFPFLL